MERREVDDGACLVRAGIFTLTVTSAVAAYRAAAAGDVAAVAFVAASYAALLLLLACLRSYERAPPAPPGDGRRHRIRRAVWALSTLLTVLFAWRVAGVVPWPAAALAWVLAAASTLGGYVALFHRP